LFDKGQLEQSKKKPSGIPLAQIITTTTKLRNSRNKKGNTLFYFKWQKDVASKSREKT
jgi:hypothetical protein